MLLRIIFFSFLLKSIDIFSQKKDSIKVDIKNIGKTINSPFADFAPVISADGVTMMFTSRRPVSDKEKSKQRESKEYIYKVDFDSKKKKWSKVEILNEEVNISGMNNSAIALSNDGQRMLVYVDENKGDIYESQLNGLKWSKPITLGEPINSQYHESSASISPDGKTIYFISDRKGGVGGRDIWYCSKELNGKWGVAKNIGKQINTTADEEGVYIHPDGKTLYFSSKGHKSIGGYDIYKSVFENETWTTPSSLGKPLNTVEDDVYFVMAANGKKGYYSSSMLGGAGEKDLYEVNFTSIEKKKDIGPKLTLFKGIVVDKENMNVLESIIEITDNQKNEIISRVKSNSATGQFLVSLPSGKNYAITVKKEGYLFYSDNVSIADTSAYQEISKIIPLEKIKLGSKIVLNNVFYDFDKATLKEESKSELENLISLMNENKSLKIEISSHTDNKGSEDYNLKLSQERAQSVVDFLITKNINKERLVAKGYGESLPLSKNDTDEGRQINRRTEFKILN